MTLYRVGGAGVGSRIWEGLGRPIPMENRLGEGRGADVKRTLGIRPQSWREEVCDAGCRMVGEGEGGLWPGQKD